MSQIDYREFGKKIDKSDFSSIYFFYGPEKYMLIDRQQKLLNKVKPENFEQLNFSLFTDESTVDEISDAVYSLPFMAEYKCVLVKDFNIETKNQTEINKLQEILDDPCESTILIFSLQTLNIDLKKSAKWRKFLKTFEKNFVSVNFDYMTRSDLNKFIIRICETNNSEISKQNADKIIEYCGLDMKNLKNEAEKLAAFCKGREITISDIDDLCVKSLDTTVFILIKAIVANDYKKAYSLLNLLFNSGEEPVPVLARISDTYVDLYRVRAALHSGKTATSPAEYGDYKGREFRLTNAQRDIRNLSSDNLRKSLELLTQTDLLLKTSKTSGKIILQELIAKLLIINKGESFS